MGGLGLASGALGASPPSPQIGSIEQHSEGACSPPIVDNQGQVSISCEAIDKNALRYLEQQLSAQFRQLSEQVQPLMTQAERSAISMTSMIICGSRQMTGRGGFASSLRDSRKAGTTAYRQSKRTS